MVCGLLVRYNKLFFLLWSNDDFFSKLVQIHAKVVGMLSSQSRWKTYVEHNPPGSPSWAIPSQSWLPTFNLIVPTQTSSSSSSFPQSPPCLMVLPLSQWMPKMIALAVSSAQSLIPQGPSTMLLVTTFCYHIFCGKLHLPPVLPRIYKIWGGTILHQNVEFFCGNLPLPNSMCSNVGKSSQLHL